MIHFPVKYNEILALLDQVDVINYGISRNYFNGAVSRLSPYLSRGVITLPQVKKRILERFTFEESYRFVFELAWREYFQRTWWKYQDEILKDLKNQQEKVDHHQLIKNVVEATTGIKTIDQQVEQLYESGYMHNHARMYIASITCNVGQSHWLAPSQWMYYHLLDGDVASNALSWQWVAGTFSSKKYYCNQENINTYSQSEQLSTFVDMKYENLATLKIPKSLRETTSLNFFTILLPTSKEIQLDYSSPLLIYNSYQLDPKWKKEISANRILLLEPSHFDFEKYPVSEKVMNFILHLAENIMGIQIFVGEVNEIPGIEKFLSIYSKAHPAFKHYPGQQDEVDWMFPDAELKNSFTSFWKSCEKSITSL